jgi:hypothetical protein
VTRRNKTRKGKEKKRIEEKMTTPEPVGEGIEHKRTRGDKKDQEGRGGGRGVG